MTIWYRIYILHYTWDILEPSTTRDLFSNYLAKIHFTSPKKGNGEEPISEKSEGEIVISNFLIILPLLFFTDRLLSIFKWRRSVCPQKKTISTFILAPTIIGQLRQNI